MAKNRDKLIEMLDDGMLDASTLARDLLGWLSDDDCVDFANANDIELGEEEDHLYNDADELNAAFEAEYSGPANDKPAKRGAFSFYIDALARAGFISDDLAQSVTLHSDEN